VKNLFATDRQTDRWIHKDKRIERYTETGKNRKINREEINERNEKTEAAADWDIVIKKSTARENQNEHK